MNWRLFCTVMHKDGLAYQVYCCRELSPQDSKQLKEQLYNWGTTLEPLALSPDFRVTPSVFVPPLSPHTDPETSTLIGPVTPEDKTALIADLQRMHYSELVLIYDRANRVVGIGCKLNPTDDAAEPLIARG